MTNPILIGLKESGFKISEKATDAQILDNLSYQPGLEHHFTVDVLGSEYEVIIVYNFTNLFEIRYASHKVARQMGGYNNARLRYYNGDSEFTLDWMMNNDNPEGELTERLHNMTVNNHFQNMVSDALITLIDDKTVFETFKANHERLSELQEQQAEKEKEEYLANKSQAIKDFSEKHCFTYTDPKDAKRIITSLKKQFDLQDSKASVKHSFSRVNTDIPVLSESKSLEVIYNGNHYILKENGVDKPLSHSETQKSAAQWLMGSYQEK